jgi:hypothetical protein
MRKKYAIIIALSLAFACFSQDEQDYQEYLAQKELSPIILKAGGGTGASYGGWYGVNAEAGFGYVSLIGGYPYVNHRPPHPLHSHTVTPA